MQPFIQPGQYRHYKGNIYWVLGIVRHSETAEWLVLYGSNSKDPEWVRPYSHFFEKVKVEGEERDRFELISQSALSYLSECPG